MSHAEDSWNAALTALRAISPAEDTADIRDVLFGNVMADCTEGINVAAIRALEDMTTADQEGASWHSPDTGPSLDDISNVLAVKAEHASPGLRAAALHCLATVARTAPLRAEQLAAMALAAQQRLTDVDAEAADAAATLLAVLGIPVALLAATGVNVGGMQVEPVWRTQVSLKPRALSG